MRGFCERKQQSSQRLHNEAAQSAEGSLLTARERDTCWWVTQSRLHGLQSQEQRRQTCCDITWTVIKVENKESLTPLTLADSVFPDETAGR